MTKETFAGIMKEAFAAYGKDLSTNSGKLIMSSWYKVFKDKNETRFSNALDLHIKSKENIPRVNQILALMKDVGNSDSADYICHECGSETDYLYRIGPSYPNPVCIDCYELAHSEKSENANWYKQLSTEYGVPMEAMPLHLMVANKKEMPLPAYLLSLPKSHEQFREYFKGKNITIGGERIKL